MIPATFTLIVAATSSVLSVNALPIFSGFFASPASRDMAPAAAPIQRRDLTGAQLAQGTNAFFGTLLLEDVCTPGQVSCINNNTATCSGEGNWEITPCTGTSTCVALPASTDPSNTDLVVKCEDPASAITAIEQAGGSQELSVDFSVDTAPFNATIVDNTPAPTDDGSVPTDSEVPTATDSFTDVPTTTDSSAPDATCTGDDGSDDGSNDGSDDGSNDGSDDGSDDGTPEFTQSLGGDIPTGTDAATDPTATCSDDVSEPTITEFITVIAIPDPTDSNQISYSTIEPADATETLSYEDPTPTDVPTDGTTDSILLPTETVSTSTEDPNGSDANVPVPTDSASTTVPCAFPEPQVTSSDSTDVPTDTPTDAAPTDVPTTTTSVDSGEPTTLSVPADFSIVSGPVPDINTVGTFAIPAPSVTPAPARRRSMQKKVRRS